MQGDHYALTMQFLMLDAMTPILDADSMRKADRRAMREFGLSEAVLTENASRGSWETLIKEFGSVVPRGPLNIVVLCGGGNNGGDGLALVRHALNSGHHATALLLAPEEKLSRSATMQLRTLRAMAPECVTTWKTFRRQRLSADVIVDAMLGTGASGSPRRNYASAITWSNQSNAIRLAIDIPTGIDADTGVASGSYFLADATATMGALKPGLLLNDGRTASGRITVVDIGAPRSLYTSSTTALLDQASATALLAPIEPARHKYTRGRVLLLAGSRGMTGAGVLAAHGALRAGGGLVVLGEPSRGLDSMPQRIRPEVMTLLLPSMGDGTFSEDGFDDLVARSESYAAIAVGPGMARSQGSHRAIVKLLAGAATPVVLDADGLFGYNGRISELNYRSCELVITPHHGEMGRLLSLSASAIGADPIGHARRSARQLSCTVVLKGAPTVVAAPDGRVWINAAGNPGMATGGSGDVLTGVIASQIAQNRDVLSGTLAGVFLHSLAGDIAAADGSERSLIASDIVDALPRAFQQCCR